MIPILSIILNIITTYNKDPDLSDESDIMESIADGKYIFLIYILNTKLN